MAEASFQHSHQVCFDLKKDKKKKKNTTWKFSFVSTDSVRGERSHAPLVPVAQFSLLILTLDNFSSSAGLPPESISTVCHPLLNRSFEFILT